MDAEIALTIIEEALGDEHLSKLQIAIFRDTWDDLPYQETARKLGYELGYVKQAGSQLWRSLSGAFGEKVSKTNLRSAIKRYLKRQETTISEHRIHPLNLPSPPTPLFSAVPTPENPTPTLTDWGEAVDVSIFYGRDEELATLARWVIHDRCRLVGLFGMGGIGKTALSVKLAQQVMGCGVWGVDSGETMAPQPDSRFPFQYVIWRSLRNAPPLHQVLTDVISFLSNHQENFLPDELDRQMLRLLAYLRAHRCLLILDNAETVMQPGDRDGSYLPGYAGYGQLLRCVAETEHQSCLVLTSREKPKGFAPREGQSLPVRSLHVKGLPAVIGQELFHAKGEFFGTPSEWQTLITHYAGNPLALKIVATAIVDFFGGSIAQFLAFSQQGNSVFGSIRDLLERQIGRLSDLEQQVMVWLAINREPISFAELQADCFPPVQPNQLLDTLTALERRSLIERSKTLFTLQPAVMEHITECLIEQVCDEISSDSAPGTPSYLKTHALIKATAQDYVRDAQIRLIGHPLLKRLRQRVGEANLDCRLMQRLSEHRGQPIGESGYSGGNLINLLCQLEVDLSQRDFSHLTLWQAYLRKVPLHGTNLAHTDLSKSVFTETFSQILAVAFSPDGTLLAASDISYEVHIWRVADGKKVLTCTAQDGWAWAVTFSPDRRLLASSANGTIHLWDVETGACLKTFSGYTNRVFSLAFSPNGCYLASGNENHQIRIWEVATGTLIATLTEHTDEVHSVQFSPDGRLLASGSYDQTVKIWDLTAMTTSQPISLQNPTAKITLIGHTDWVWSVAFSPDGATLASSSSDRTIKLWDVTTGHCHRTLTGHAQAVQAIAFTPSPSTPTQTPILVSGSDDHTVRLWNLQGECTRVLQGHTSWVSSVAISPDGMVIATGSEDQSVRLWHSRTNQCLKVLQGYNSGVWSIAISPDGNTLVSGGQDRVVRLWRECGEGRTGKGENRFELAAELGGHQRWIWSVAYSPDGTAIASGSEDSTICVWDVPPGAIPAQPYLTLRGHNHAVWAVAFSPDGTAIASGSLDGTVRLWQRHTGACHAILQQHRSGIFSLAFAPHAAPTNPNTYLLASGSQDQTICLWEITTPVNRDIHAGILTGKLLKTLGGHTSWIRCVAFNPTGEILASGSSDGTVKLWHVATGECIHTLQAHTSLVLAVTFSPDGHVLATSGGDGTIHLWHLPHSHTLTLPHSHTPTLPLHGHTKWVRYLAYHPSGKWLASCSQDGAVKLWDGRSRTCLMTLRVPRPYEGANITSVTGLTEAQIETLRLLGAVTTADGDA